ncbi:MAG: hypothetical protein PHX13_10600 [Thiovulaceae bacterium]|nr:hypothetical protein [Sulfurimonadaceae bacterium]
MNSFKLKLLLTLLGGIIFSLIFILLALVIPTTHDSGQMMNLDKPVTTAAQLAKAIKDSNK